MPPPATREKPTVRKRVTARERLERFGPGSAGQSMTPEEFDALLPTQFQRGCRYEILNGLLIVSPQPGIGERRPNDYLGTLLDVYRETHPKGNVIDDTVPEQTVPTTNRRRADRVIWTGLKRTPNEAEDVPSIVIEFVSKRRRDTLRDYETKRDEYLAAGVREYWIIDRFRRVMTVYRQKKAKLTHEIVTEGHSYETGLLPGFSLPLDKLLAKADQWARKPKRPLPRQKPNPPAGGTDQ